MFPYCGWAGCERFLQPALGSLCQACASQLVSFCAPPAVLPSSTGQWAEYPLTGSDAGATQFDPLWSAGLQSTKVSIYSLKRLLYLLSMQATLLQHDCQTALVAVSRCFSPGSHWAWTDGWSFHRATKLPSRQHRRLSTASGLAALPHLEDHLQLRYTEVRNRQRRPSSYITQRVTRRVTPPDLAYGVT